MTEWLMLKLFKKMRLSLDASQAEYITQHWVSINDIRLGEISPWGNTYYGYTEGVLEPARWVMHPRKYAILRLKRIKAIKKATK